MKYQNIGRTIASLILATAVGFIADRAGVPIGWLLGSLLVGIVCACLQSDRQPLSSNWIKTGKAMIGVYSASRFSPDTLVLATTYSIPVILCISITGILSIFNGYLLWKLARVDKLSGFLGSIPGSAATLAVMSEEFGADSMTVTLLQYIRMVIVVLTIPTIAAIALPHETSRLLTLSEAIVGESSVPMFLNLLVLAGCCFLGTVLGQWLKLPTSGFLGSFLLGLLVFWILPYSFIVPYWLWVTALILVGFAIGWKFDWPKVRQLWKAVLLEIALVMLLFCLGIGYEFHLVTHIDTMTAVLGFTSGGIEAMIATANHLGGDTSMVLAIQLTRQMLILLSIYILTVFTHTRKTELS